MTIAVASLALASNPGKTTGASAAASLPSDQFAGAGLEETSIVAGDFASLLSGQKAKALDSEVLSLLQDPATGTELLSAAGVNDTNWVFAALGIAPPAETIARLTIPVTGEEPLDADGGGSALEGIAARRGAVGLLAEANTPLKQENTDYMVGKTLFQSPTGENPAANDGLPVAGAAILAAPLALKEFRPLHGENVVAPVAGNGMAEAIAASRPTVSQTGGAPTPVAAPLHDATWPTEFSQKIVWMSRSDVQNAQITLNPPQLGPIEISLNIRNEQATAAFVSANPEVREAIESALPRLREMLAGAGVELGQANVSAESFRQADGRQAAGGDNRGTGSSEDSSRNEGGVSPPIAAMPERRGNGLVDTFA